MDYVSSELNNIIKTIFIGTIDLSIGTVCSKLIGKLFPVVAFEDIVKSTGKTDEIPLKEGIKPGEHSLDWGDKAKEKLHAAEQYVEAEMKKIFIHRIVKLATSVIVQLSFTLIAGFGIRKITFPASLDDPTAGILFVLSLFNQPHFWINVNTLYDNLFNGFFTLFEPI